MDDAPLFARLERDFAAHLRDPGTVAPPVAIEARRLDIYRYALFAGNERFLRENYPRLHALMDPAEWEALVRNYVARHAAVATAFVDLPRDFLVYLAREAPPDPRRPFRDELAHFDWLETLVGADERRLDPDGVDAHGDLLDGIPLANPIMTLARYRYPVHVIGPDFQPLEPPPQLTWIAAFRDRDNEYGFLDLSAPAARLLELVMARRGLRGRDIVAEIAASLGHADVATLLPAAGTILARMQARDVILGTARD